MDRPSEQTITLCKAGPVTGREPPPNVTIRIEGAPPEWKSGVSEREWMEDALASYRYQGQRLADALFGSLPGGTLDQLLLAILERKACVLRVPFAGGARYHEWAVVSADDRAFVTNCLDAIRIDDEHRRDERLQALDKASALLRVVDR